MINIESINKSKLNFSDILLIFAILTSTMTELRIGKIGLSELLLAVWIFITLYKKKNALSFNIYVFFWLFFIFNMILGMLISNVKGIPGGSLISGMATYVFFLLFVFSISQHMRDISFEKGILTLKKIYFWGIYLYGFLFFIAYFISPSILSFQLWYGPRLSILAQNPHQFTFIVAPLFLLGFYLIKEKQINNKSEKTGFVIGSALFLWMGFETESSTFVGSITFLFIINLLFGNYFNFKSTSLAIYRLLVSVLIGGIVSILILPLTNFIYEFISSDENGLGRVILWGLGLEKTSLSPIFGLGPGAYIEYTVDNVFFEAHNLYIDIATRGGILSLMFFCLVIFYSLYKLRFNLYALNFIGFFLLYGMAGYTLRRITMWFFIIFLVYLANKTVVQSKKEGIQNEI